MKFAKTKGRRRQSVNDKTTVIYNERITIRNILLEAYGMSSAVCPPSTGRGATGRYH